MVTRTGDNTMIGSIAALASSGSTHETLLQQARPIIALRAALSWPLLPRPTDR